MSTGDQIFTNLVQEVFSPLYQLAVGISLLYFLYGVVKYVVDLNNPEKKTLGRSHLFWGSIGLFIVFSVGGILNVMSGVLGGWFK